jgi:hypothetical protein
MTIRWRIAETNSISLEIPQSVIARFMRATQFVFWGGVKMGCPDEPGNDG